MAGNIGTRITIDQQAQAPNVVLMITATQSCKHIERERSSVHIL